VTNEQTEKKTDDRLSAHFLKFDALLCALQETETGVLYDSKVCHFSQAFDFIFEFHFETSCAARSPPQYAPAPP